MQKTITLPELNEGELYAGILLGKNGEPDHHLILLPGESEPLSHPQAIKFAIDGGGALPTRREQSLLYTNCKDQFQNEWYWSSEQHAAYSDCAWMQNFLNGFQSNVRKSSNYRARAVRRLIIE